MAAPAVKINGLEFGYPSAGGVLFSGLELTVMEGLRFGLFGPNGAGKTSLMSLMTGLLPFRHGSIEIAGLPIGNKLVKTRIGLVPQDLSFYEELTPVENLAFYGAWYRMPAVQIKNRTKELLAILQLEEAGDRRASQLSGGMKRKLNLAIGVMHGPRVLFLDEPTVGVDVHTRQDILQFLIGLNRQGTTLIYTSHQLDEAEALCQRVALIDRGRLIACDELSALLAVHEQDGLEGLFLQLTGKTYGNE